MIGLYKRFQLGLWGVLSYVLCLPLAFADNSDITSVIPLSEATQTAYKANGAAGGVDSMLAHFVIPVGEYILGIVAFYYFGSLMIGGISEARRERDYGPLKQNIVFAMVLLGCVAFAIFGLQKLATFISQ